MLRPLFNAYRGNRFVGLTELRELSAYAVPQIRYDNTRAKDGLLKPAFELLFDGNMSSP